MFLNEPTGLNLGTFPSGCMSLGRLFHISAPYLNHLSTSDNNSAFLRRPSWGLNDVENLIQNPVIEK